MIVKQIKPPKLPNCDSELHLRIPKEVEDEIENYGTRYERFLEEWDHGMDIARMEEWLK